MNGREIQDALAGVLGDRVDFLGCHEQRRALALVHLAKKRTKPCMFILNTLNATNGSHIMGHWFTVYINYHTQTIGYYDSYNLHPKFNSRILHHFMKTHPQMKIDTLPYRLQGLDSLVCGLYSMVLCFLLSRHPLKRVMAIIRVTFKRHKYLYNDKKVTRIAYNIFKTMPECLETFCPTHRGQCRDICPA